jgi:hypothetical protein
MLEQIRQKEERSNRMHMGDFIFSVGRKGEEA